jgi:hypothetical protein
MYNKNILENIETFGEYYFDNFLKNKYKKKDLKENWWKGLLFFFAHIFSQGRRDIISGMVMNNAIIVLKKHIFEDDAKASFNNLKNNNWETIEGELSKVIGPGKIGKKRDIEMTIFCLKFIENIPEMNIIKYSIEKVKKGNLHEHYMELLQLRQIGPKIASFYLRDIIMFYKLEKDLEKHINGDYTDLLPIDTWIKKNAIKFNIINEEETDDNQIRKNINEVCIKNNISPMYFNAGLWYIGSHAYEILNIKKTQTAYNRSVYAAPPTGAWPPFG